jgi:hypothetical protein
MTLFGVILRAFLNPILTNTNEIGGTFEIMAQKDPVLALNHAGFIDIWPKYDPKVL